MEKTKELLKSLCKIPAISGGEHNTLNAFKELFGANFDDIYTDNVGNIVMLKKCGKENAKRLMLDAHLDTVGLMVTEVYKDGFLSVCSIGGIDTRILPASEVTIYGKEPIYGVIASTPPHLGGGSSVPKMESVLIDTGIKDESVKDIINIGDYVAIKGDFRELAGGYVMSAGLDDRACLCSIIEAVLNAASLTYDVYVVASAMEETGNGGVRNVVFDINPDIVIATDVGFARETDIEARCSIECKKGPSVDLSVILDRALSKNILKIANESGIPCQVVVDGSRTGTNADTISISGKGSRLALMSLPLKAMHTSCESVNLYDIKCLADILTLVISSKEGAL